MAMEGLMEQVQSPARLLALARKYPAIDLEVRHALAPNDGIPTTIHVGIQAADEAFLGWKPSCLAGPERFLQGNDGLIGTSTQRLSVINPNGAHLAPLTLPNTRNLTVRDLFRNRTPSEIAYFIVHTSVRWYAFLPTRSRETQNQPCGALLHRHTDLMIRTPPKTRGGFAGLLNSDVREDRIYYCVENHDDLTNLPLHYPEGQWVRGQLNELTSAVSEVLSFISEERLLDRFPGLSAQGFELRIAQDAWLNSVLEISTNDALIRFTDEGIGSLTLTSFFGTLKRLTWIVQRFLIAWGTAETPASSA